MDGADHGPLTILVVDDEPDLCTIIRRMLDGRGHTVLVAEGVAEAIATSGSAAQPVDLLITDLRMPDGDGRTLAELLRAQRPELQVLYMSGLPSGDEAWRRPGPQQWILAKPFTPAELLTAVGASLTRA